MTSRLSRKKIRHAMIMAVLVSLFALFANLSGLSDVWERKTVDVRSRLCRSGTVLPDDIVIILVDDASLQALNEVAGRWPWPRYIHAELIDYLALSGATSIVMDITFSENQIDTLADTRTLDPNDARLAESTYNAGNVVHAIQLTSDEEDEYNMALLNQPLPESMVRDFSLNVDARAPVMDNNMYYLPFEELLDSSAALGVVTFFPDEDGVNRSEQIVFNYHGHYFPAHSLAPILMDRSYDSLRVGRNQVVLRGNDVDALTIPLDENHEYYVNPYGYYNTFSYSGVIESWMKVQQGITEGLMVPPEEFQGKIVYVGASAAATQDLKNTAMGNETPGVFLHASICGNILTGDYLHFTGFFANIAIFLPLLFVCMFCVLFLRKIYYQIYLPLTVALFYTGLSVLLFNFNIVIHLAVPLSTMFLAYFLSFGYISFTEGKEKRKVKNILGQYVSPAMLTQVFENSKEEYLKAEVGTKEYLTVFFSDIRGFTSISEQYPVEKVVEVLNAYLSEMVDIIFENSGTLDKFIGDAIVAFWGAPIRFEDHPYKAVLSALQMMEALKDLNRRNEEKGLPHLSIGIGIHSDHVILGNIGSRKKLDYTVIGDGVNLTSRLEGLTKAYGCPVLISESCYEHIKDRICCRVADYVKVKGKNEPITIYHAMGLFDAMDPWDKTLAEKSTQAFDLYLQGRFDQAKQIYDDILRTDPDDGLAILFSSRCEALIQTPPEKGWSGCFVHQTK